MNHCKFAARLALLLGLTGTASAGVASAPGATSRGTVSISITVPPHVVVSRLAGADREPISQANATLCVAAVGYSSYHVALVASGEAAIESPDNRASAAMTAEAAGRSSCSAGHGSDPGWKLDLRHWAAQPLAGSSAPLTVLIVPD